MVAIRSLLLCISLSCSFSGMDAYDGSWENVVSLVGLFSMAVVGLLTSYVVMVWVIEMDVCYMPKRSKRWITYSQVMYTAMRHGFVSSGSLVFSGSCHGSRLLSPNGGFKQRRGLLTLNGKTLIPWFGWSLGRSRRNRIDGCTSRGCCNLWPGAGDIGGSEDFGSVWLHRTLLVDAP